MVGIGGDDPLHLGPGQGPAHLGVGVGQDDHLPQIQIVLHPHREIRLKGDDICLHLVEVGEDLVKAIGHVGVGGLPGLPGKGPEGEVQNIIGPVGDEDLVGPEAVDLGQLLNQGPAHRVGVEAEIPHLFGVDGRHHLGGRRIGRFIGVQLGIDLVLGLLAGGIDLQMGQTGIQETAHDSSPSKRTVALLAWASRPSCRAKAATWSATRPRASRVK